MDSNTNITSATDVLLLLLYAPGTKNEEGEEIKGITRLEKLMFLLYKQSSFKDVIGKDYKFDSYDYGPFSSEIFDDIEALKISGILHEETFMGEKLESIDFEENEMNVNEDISNILSMKKYKLTKKGFAISKILFDSINDKQKAEIINIKKKFNSIPITNLLTYVYNNYPDVTKKSVIKNKILKYYY